MTKKELTERCREILRHTPLKQKVADEDAEWLMDNIFPHHPEWDWYQRLPVYNIYTDKADHGTKCFYIRWMSLDTSSISYIKCIKNIKNTRQ